MEQEVTQAAENNQMESMAAEQDVEQASEPQESAGQATGSEPEFTDVNMQRRWTEKTTELAEQRKAFESQQAEWQKQQSEVQKKIDLYNRLDSDPEIVSFVKKRWGLEEEAPAEITENDYYAAQNDPAKFRELVRREAAEMAKQQVQPLKQDLTAMKALNELSAYASDKGNEDFWALDKAGLIEPQILMLKQKNPRAPHMEIVKRAHDEARRIINAITSETEKKAMAKASGVINDKKTASVDKGTGNIAPAMPSAEGKTIMEIYQEIKKRR